MAEPWPSEAEQKAMLRTSKARMRAYWMLAERHGAEYLALYHDEELSLDGEAPG